MLPTTKTLTILVPCYNVANCINRCVDSLLVGDCLNDIEILLVNDGSTDNSLSLMLDYEHQYPDSVRVINKSNGGWGSVVNMGIREASGKYFKVVDADDQLATENIKEYLLSLQTHDVDCLLTNYTEINQSGNTSYFDNQQFSNASVTFHTSLLRDNNIVVGDRYYSDIEFITYTLPYLKSQLYLPINLYIYYRTNEGQSTSQKGYAAHYRDMLSLSLRLITFYNTLPKTTPDDCRNYVFDKAATSVAMSYKLMMSPSYAGRKNNIKAELKEYDNQLHRLSTVFYKSASKVKNHGVPYIAIWRLTCINLLLLRH